MFNNGGSQAIRLPKDCRFSESEVLVNRIGNVVILFPREDRWQNLLTSLDLSYSKVTDIGPLLELENLQVLYIDGLDLPQEQVDDITEMLDRHMEEQGF